MKQLTLFILLLSLTSVSFAESTKYKIGVKEAPPFTFLNDQNEWDGVNIWLWREIAHRENLNFEWVDLTKDSFKNSSTDIIIYPLIADQENLELYNFSPSYFTTNSTILINNITGFKAVWNFIKSILSLNFLKLVIAIFSLLLMMGLIVWRLERSSNPEQFKDGLKGIGNGIWWSAVTLSTVGYGDIAPKSLGGRIIGTIWMFAGILVVSAFTASMASLLTVGQINASKNSVSDYKHKKIGAIHESTSQAYLKHNFFRNIIPYKDINEGFYGLQNNEINAFVCDEAFLRYFINQLNLEDCRILPHRFNPQYYALGISKNNEALHLQISKRLLEILGGVEWQLLLEEYEISYH